MRILPVIDLKGGAVVRGIGGRREEYRPIQSCLAADSDPREIARAFVERFGLREVYVADLDAIAGREPDWSSLRAIAESGLRIMLDAGLNSAEPAQRLIERSPSVANIDRWIVGLESVASPSELSAIFKVLGADRAVFSLDLKNGQPITDSAAWSSTPVESIARSAIESGFSSIIVLDLAAVGTANGPATLDVCRRLRHDFPGIELISGGGIRDAPDIRQFHTAGVNAVLVSTALHDGQLTGKVSY